MLGDYEGWYCPNEGFRNTSDLVEDERGVHCPNHPDVELQWLTERNWFFRLSSYQERLERHYAEHPDWVAPEYRKNEMLGFIRQGLEDFSVSRALIMPTRSPTSTNHSSPKRSRSLASWASGVAGSAVTGCWGVSRRGRN